MSEYDGYVVIGTKLDSKELKQDLANQKKELQKYTKEAERLTKQKTKLELDLSDYYEQKRLIEEHTNEILQNSQTQQEVNNQIEIEKRLLDELNEKYSKKLETLNKINQKIEDNRIEQKKLNQEINNTETSLKKVQNYSDIKGSIDDTNKSIGSIVKKVGKWALAVFSLRTAYSAVRNAVSTISQYDEQISADINYITYALSMTLKPLVEWIVNASKKLMYYIGYIANQWFGIDIWANSSAESMNATNKSAKELKKTLLGFDEINQLSDNSNDSSGIKTPSFDLSNGLADKDVPKWLKWIGEHKEEILAVVAGLTTFFVSKKIVDGITLLMGSASAGTGLLGLSTTLAQLALIGVIAIEIVVLYEQVVKAKEAIDDYNETQNELKDSAGKLTGRMDEVIQKFNETGGAVNKTDEEVRDYVDTLFSNIESNNNLIESMEETKNLLGELTGANDIATEAQDVYRESIVKQIDELENLYNQGKLTDEEAQRFVDTIEEQITALENSYDPLRKNTEEYANNKKIAEELRKKLEDLSGTYDVDVKMNVDTSKGKSKLSNFFSTLGENIVNFILPGNLSYKSIMSKIKFLASGGIIDVPGRGVPLASNVIGGEAGAEGVLPLTNADTMSKLGREIGKWITLNINLTSEIDGRILNKRLETIRNNDEFSRNGG